MIGNNLTNGANLSTSDNNTNSSSNNNNSNNNLAAALAAAAAVVAAATSSPSTNQQSNNYSSNSVDVNATSTATHNCNSNSNNSLGAVVNMNSSICNNLLLSGGGGSTGAHHMMGNTNSSNKSSASILGAIGTSMSIPPPPAAALPFNEQVALITGLFDRWNDCERTVVLYALIKRLRYTGMKFLHHTIECQMSQDMGSQPNLSVIVLDINANNPSYLQNLLNSYKTAPIQAATSASSATASTTNSHTNGLDLMASAASAGVESGAIVTAPSSCSPTASISSGDLQVVDTIAMAFYGGDNNTNNSNNTNNANTLDERNMCYSRKDDILQEFLNLLPLLKPGNEEAKMIYISMIPLVVTDTIQQLVGTKLVQQIFSYLLIHPAVSSDDRRALHGWLRHLEDHLTQQRPQQQQQSLSSVRHSPTILMQLQQQQQQASPQQQQPSSTFSYIGTTTDVSLAAATSATTKMSLSGSSMSSTSSSSIASSSCSANCATVSRNADWQTIAPPNKQQQQYNNQLSKISPPLLHEWSTALSSKSSFTNANGVSGGGGGRLIDTLCDNFNGINVNDVVGGVASSSHHLQQQQHALNALVDPLCSASAPSTTSGGSVAVSTPIINIISHNNNNSSSINNNNNLNDDHDTSFSKNGTEILDFEPQQQQHQLNGQNSCDSCSSNNNNSNSHQHHQHQLTPVGYVSLNNCDQLDINRWSLDSKLAALKTRRSNSLTTQTLMSSVSASSSNSSVITVNDACSSNSTENLAQFANKPRSFSLSLEHHHHQQQQQQQQLQLGVGGGGGLGSGIGGGMGGAGSLTNSGSDTRLDGVGGGPAGGLGGMIGLGGGAGGISWASGLGLGLGIGLSGANSGGSGSVGGGGGLSLGGGVAGSGGSGQVSGSNDYKHSNYIKFQTRNVGMSNIGMWLKSLRLHKYIDLFKNMGYEEMMDITEEYLQSLGVTKGASHKLALCIEKLKERSQHLGRLEQDLLQGDVRVETVVDELANMVLTPMKPIEMVNALEDNVAHNFLKVVDLVGSIIQKDPFSCQDDDSLNVLMWILDRSIHNEAFIGHLAQLKDLKYKISKIKMAMPKNFHNKNAQNVNGGTNMNKPRWNNKNRRDSKTGSNDRISHRKNSNDMLNFSLNCLQQQHHPPQQQQQQQINDYHQQQHNGHKYQQQQQIQHMLQQQAHFPALPQHHHQQSQQQQPSLSQQQQQQQHRRSLNNLIVISGGPQQPQKMIFKPGQGLLSQSIENLDHHHMQQQQQQQQHQHDQQQQKRKASLTNNMNNNNNNSANNNNNNSNTISYTQVVNGNSATTTSSTTGSNNNTNGANNNSTMQQHQQQQQHPKKTMAAVVMENLAKFDQQFALF